MGYIGKDVIHEGCGLPIQSELVWKSVPYSVRYGIHKAEKNNIKVIEVKGNNQDIDILRNMWYDPDDPNMPTELRESDYMFIAYIKEEPIGVIILLPVGNHLFLNNLAGSKAGKKIRIQDYLLWYSVNYFEKLNSENKSNFDYIDVGVSYRSSLYNFFKKWKVASYPILFNPPEIKVEINDYPFSSYLYKRNFDYSKIDDTISLIAKMTSAKENMTFVPSEEFAKNILGEGAEDKTFSFPDIQTDKPVYINLYNIFNVQFGTLILNLTVDDADLWNKYGCLDVYKRQFVLSSIYEELVGFDKIVNQRKENLNYIKELFGFEGIKFEESYAKNETIPAYFYFKYDRNWQYHDKLNDFSIKHKYYADDMIIALPIHQNLTKWQLEYMYGIFRGVLNLCSEWAHTDVYGKFKK